MIDLEKQKAPMGTQKLAAWAEKSGIQLQNMETQESVQREMNCHKD